jgi:hypothetical protein
MDAKPCSFPGCRRTISHTSGRCIYHRSWKDRFDPEQVPATPLPDMR